MIDVTHKPQFTNREKMQAAQREVGYRRWVYPKRVAEGKMAQAAADKEVALMDEISRDYGEAAKQEQLL